MRLTCHQSMQKYAETFNPFPLFLVDDTLEKRRNTCEKRSRCSITAHYGNFSDRKHFSPRYRLVVNQSSVMRIVPQSTVEDQSRYQTKCLRTESLNDAHMICHSQHSAKSSHCVFSRQTMSTVFTSGNVHWEQRLNRSCEPVRVLMYLLCMCQTATSKHVVRLANLN
jgi:hypothetical protein